MLFLLLIYLYFNTYPSFIFIFLLHMTFSFISSLNGVENGIGWLWLCLRYLLVSMLYLHYREKYRDLFVATLSINACFLNCSLFQKKKTYFEKIKKFARNIMSAKNYISQKQRSKLKEVMH